MMPMDMSMWLSRPVSPRMLTQLMVRMMKLIQKGSMSNSMSSGLNLLVVR